MAKILIIDDDINICQLLDRFFKRKGHESTFFTSGKKGIDHLREHKADIVFCDFRLPDADGKELLKSIKEINADIQVIIITGYSDIKTAVDVIKIGAFDYVTKPLLPEEILLLVERALNEKQTRTEKNGEGYETNAAVSLADKNEDVSNKKSVSTNPVAYVT
ncbi:MAG: response regulator, partial [Bacteroidia bacterium]|nr:response regulator [Bacteroidia bacterium]